MKYSIECEVDSKIILDEDIRYYENGKEFILISDENKLLSVIKIIADVSNPSLFYSNVESCPETRMHYMIINRDNQIYEELIDEFQQIESILAFSTQSLRKIYWENPKEELIPETEKEKEKLSVIGINWEMSHHEKYTPLNENEFTEMMEDRDKYADLRIPKAFFREGINDFESFRYINAFYNFYFIIEDLYGGGKSKNKDVEKELKKSDEFKSFVQWMIDNLHNDNKKHFDNICNYLKRHNKNFDIDGLIFIIVRMRGQLHHYSGKSTQVHGTPFNQKDFESIAYLSLGLAVRAILHKILEINTQNNKM